MKIALVLEGGGLRGVYTAGVLDILMKHNIEVDTLIGVSAGALNGMNFLSKQEGRAARINIENCKNSSYIGRKAILKSRGIFGFDYLFGEMSHTLYPFAYETFEKAKEKFYAVATNCKTGEAEYFEKQSCKDIFLAVQASASLPLASQMVVLEDIPYLDGAVADSVPVEWVLEQGYDKIIVVLTRDKKYRKKECSSKMKKLYGLAYKKYPELLGKLYTAPQRYNELRKKIDSLEENKEIYVIRPQEEVLVSRIEKDRTKLEDLYKQALEQTEEEIPQIKKYLEE